MITTANVRLTLRVRHFRQRLLSRNQERQKPSFDAASRPRQSSFVLRSHPAEAPVVSRSPDHDAFGIIFWQAAEYRARSAGRQLGAKILESVPEIPAKTVLLLRFFRPYFNSRPYFSPVVSPVSRPRHPFCDFPSSEVNYTALEPARKGVRKNLPACWQIPG